jgi:hypothetical protein
MAQILFAAEAAVTTDWLTYVENEAQALSQSDEFAIDNYSDRELLNPEVQDFLENEFPFDDQEDSAFTKAVNFHSVSLSEFALSFDQNKAIAGKAFLFGRWRRLKEAIRKVFCEVTLPIIGNPDFGWKDIIKAVLIGLIPVFASGLPALVLPIIIAFIASLMKYGYGKVCPV